jgi:hypothetical protein
MLGFSPLFGQMILTDEDAGLNARAGSDATGINVMVPLQNSNLDQWKTNVVPLADGLLLLAGLGGAYLLKKKRSKK